MVLELSQRQESWRPGWLVAIIFPAIVSISWVAGGSNAHAETTYTPVVELSQRYDSNVFYTAKQFLPAGTQEWDLVTTTTAGLKVLNKSRLGDTEVQAYVSGNVYAYNTDLSYASTNVLATSDVSDWMQELLPGLKLRLSDKFLYTPEPPAFLTGGKPQESDVFARGIQGSRANTYANILSTDGGYSVSRSVELRAKYAYSIFHVGSRFVSNPTITPFAYFDITSHNVTTGPAFGFDGGDTLFLKYNYLSSEQTPTSGGTTFKFTAHSIQPEYFTKFVRDWTATISGGATVVEQAGNRTFFSGKFALTNDFDQRTRVSMSVSRQATPAFFGTGGAWISNVAQLYVSHNLSRVITLTVSGNYAQNETAQGPKLTIETIYGTAALDYKLTRSTKVSLLQTYAEYHYTATPFFDRYATMLMLTTEWN